MAALVVTIAGGSAGAVASAAFFDAFVLPRLLQGPDPKPPSAGDYPVGGVSEGEPVYWGVGPEVRVPGFVRWRSPLRVVGGETGGKGGGSQGTSLERFADMDVAFLDVPDPSVGAASVKRIYGSGRLLYDGEVANVVVTDNTIDVEFETFGTDGTPLTDEWDGYVRIRLSSSSLVTPGFNDNGISDGDRVTIDNVPSPFDGLTWTVSAFNSGAPSALDPWVLAAYLTTEDVPSAVNGSDINGGVYDQSAGTSITITWTRSVVDQVADDITIYLGTDAQTADSLIESDVGVGDVPGWRGSVHAVFDNLNLTRVGISPQFIAVVEERASCTVAQAVSAILDRLVDEDGNKLMAGLYDVSGIDAQNIRGYFVRGAQPLVEQLRPLMFAYDLLVQEKDGKLYFFSRANAVGVVVSDADLAAHEFGSDAPRRLESEDVDDESLPTEVIVNYTDPDLEDQRGSQPYSPPQRRYTSNTLTVNLEGLTLSASDAQAIARRIYWQRHGNRRRVALQLPPSYFHAVEGDKLTVTEHGETVNVLVRDRDQGANGLLLHNGVVENARALTVTFSPPGSGAGDGGSTIPTPPSMLLYVLDTAPLDDSDLLMPTLYFLACAANYTSTFSGATLYESANGSTFTEIEGVSSEAALGVTVGTVAGGVSGTTWDDATTITVDIYHGSLPSATDAEVLGGANFCMWGNEFGAFGTPTLTGTNTDGSKRYTMTHLLRGLRDTTDEIDAHAANEPFVLITTNQTHSRALNLSAIGTTRYHKAVHAGVAVSAVSALPHLVAGNTLRPFAPGNVTGQRNTLGDLTIYWQYRTRALIDEFAGDPALVDTVEIYKVEVYSGATLKRTLAVQDQTFVTYDATSQTADFGSVQWSGVKVRVYNWNVIYGYGKYVEVTI